MKISTVSYSVKQGVKSLKRNKAFSLASVGTIVACLFLFGIFYFVMTNVSYMVKKTESTLSVTVFFTEDATQEMKDNIKEKALLRKEVTKVEYTSSDEAWNSVKEEFFSEDKEEVEKVFGDDNPLQNLDSYEIHIDDATKQDSLVKYLKGLEGVRVVNYAESLADKLHSFNTVVSTVAFVIMLMLLAVSVFLISITVLNGIIVRSDEIKIMKLIGATDGFVRGPFIVEGIIIGFCGAIIPLIILYFAYEKIVTYALDKIEFVLPLGMNFVKSSEIFKVLTPLSLGVGVGIGIFGTWLTLFRKLRTVS
ncbi:MAG: permease-like cell division protein FtsX [Lachnospiraceae bacterium]|nr:permease-like cell division protein FtsX [Lachnospiraceae bacterium]